MRPLNTQQMTALVYLVEHGEALADDLTSIIKDDARIARGVLRALIRRGLAYGEVHKGIMGSGPMMKWKQHMGRYTVYRPTEEGIKLCQLRQASRPASRSASSNP